MGEGLGGGRPHLCGDYHQMSEQRFICLSRMLDHRDGSLGDDEDVDRSLRAHVMERQRALVLVDNLGRDLLANNLAEDGVGSRCCGVGLVDLRHGRGGGECGARALRTEQQGRGARHQQVPQAARDTSAEHVLAGLEPERIMYSSYPRENGVASSAIHA